MRSKIGPIHATPFQTFRRLDQARAELARVQARAAQLWHEIALLESDLARLVPPGGERRLIALTDDGDEELVILSVTDSGFCDERLPCEALIDVQWPDQGKDEREAMDALARAAHDAGHEDESEARDTHP
jgi:hypothetical protein